MIYLSRSALAQRPGFGNVVKMKSWLQRLPWASLSRWFVVGIVFLGIGLGLLKIAKELLHMPLWLATAASTEVTLLIRFLVNDSWVFGHARPTWRRLWQFHVASAGGTAIAYVITVGLPSFGVDYMIAAIVGSAVSMGFSILTNFLWIWRHKETRSGEAVAAVVTSSGSPRG